MGGYGDRDVFIKDGVYGESWETIALDFGSGLCSHHGGDCFLGGIRVLPCDSALAALPGLVSLCGRCHGKFFSMRQTREREEKRERGRIYRGIETGQDRQIYETRRECFDRTLS